MPQEVVVGRLRILLFFAFYLSPSFVFFVVDLFSSRYPGHVDSIVIITTQFLFFPLQLPLLVGGTAACSSYLLRNGSLCSRRFRRNEQSRQRIGLRSK